MAYLLVFVVVFVVLLVVRGRARRRPATGRDALAAARVQGEFAGYDTRPHRVDPVSGSRDWGQ